jgi:hypothetical protein
MPELGVASRMKNFYPVPIAASVPPRVLSVPAKQVTPVAVSHSPVVPSTQVNASAVSKPVPPTLIPTAPSQAATQSTSAASALVDPLPDTTAATASSTQPASPPVKRARLSSGLVAASANDEGATLMSGFAPFFVLMNSSCYVRICLQLAYFCNQLQLGILVVLALFRCGKRLRRPPSL